MPEGEYLNLDKEVWRKDLKDSSDPDNFYAPNILVTPEQAITICVGGLCITKTIEDWHDLARGRLRAEIKKLRRQVADLEIGHEIDKDGHCVTHPDGCSEGVKKKS